MGKKQHQKDKLYLTTTEWSQFYGGKKQTAELGKNSEFKRLPFFCCSLSMQPFDDPYCTKEGHIFDILNILPFLKQYGVNPVTGEKLTRKDLYKLNFHKNSSDKFHCPVTFKIFNENTHIVAVKTTGNVFSFEAIERLNIKTNFWKDLITDEPFIRKDLITIQDPNNLDKFNLSAFYHIQKDLKVIDADFEKLKKDPRYTLKTINSETKQILDELDKTYKAPVKIANTDAKADSVNAAHYSTGRVAASFTSTAMDPITQMEAAIIDEDILRYERIKKKAYIKINTTLGPLNLELHSDMVPKTCENFLKHCLSGYYDDTKFHRSIRNFMIQGGDPNGTGKGGESIWGKEFKDEFKPNLTHSGRGVLSMANSGPNTNKSQFFITYRSARHLDNKHTVFGRVVGGLETIDKMEKIETNDKDELLKEIRVLNCQVFVNPFDEVDQQLIEDRLKVNEIKEEKEIVFKNKAKKEEESSKKGDEPNMKPSSKSGVGKYISNNAQKRSKFDDDEDNASETQIKKRQKFVTKKLRDFSDW